MSHRKDWTEWRIKRAVEHRHRRMIGESLSRLYRESELSFLKTSPFLVSSREIKIPAFTGNNIQFFTHGLSS